MRATRVVTRVIPLMLGAALLLAPAGSRAGHNGCEEPPSPPNVEPVEPAPASLTPNVVKVAMAHGERRELRFTLVRPASPTPVDVYFLVDTTGSMGSAICGVQRDLSRIAVDLAEAGIDTHFGLGIYRDYPMSPWGSDGDFAYKRVRRIAPLDRAILRALHEMEAGGGGDGLESALAALYQSATGAGQDVENRMNTDPDIPKGQQAGFRDDALRLIVNVTDVEFREPTANEESERYGPYPGPSTELVERTLRERRILQAGIAVNGGGRRSLRNMASETGALAAEPVDCDGDGDDDLGRGDALVCDGQPDDLLAPVNGGGRPIKMANAIVSFVKSLRDEQRIAFSVEGDTRMLNAAWPATTPPVDLKRDQRLEFGIRLLCDRHAGVSKMTLRTSVRGKTVALSGVEATCDPPPLSTLGLVRAAPAAPAAQQPASQPAQQPNVQPNAQPNPQPHAQADPQSATAVVPQVMPQPQAALAQAEARLEMSAFRGRRRLPGAGFVVAAGLLLGACAAFASRTQVASKPNEEARR